MKTNKKSSSKQRGITLIALVISSKCVGIGSSKKSNNGITLIALVITVIVLLILAGISISMLSRR